MEMQYTLHFFANSYFWPEIPNPYTEHGKENHLFTVNVMEWKFKSKNPKGHLRVH